MKYFVTMHTGYVGSTAHDVVDLEGFEEEQRDSIFWEMAVDNAASFGYELCDDDCEDPDCDMEHPGSTNIEGFGVPYVPEEHDMYLI
jgi:hypothetical protein